MEKEQKKLLSKIIVIFVLLLSVYVTDNFILEDHPIYISLFLYLIPYLLIGCRVLAEAFENIIHGKIFDENFLMSIATIGALMIGFLPDSEPQFPEAVAVMLFYQVGELFEDIAVDKSRKSISDLMNIKPEYANIEIGSEIKSVSPSEVNIGDIIIIKPGEKIPLDGIVVEGVSALNTVALTGEALPRDIDVGAEVISGCINISGMIKVKANKLYNDSTVSKILELVENSDKVKAKSENFITKFARFYTPCVVTAAVLLAFIPPIISGNFTAEFSNWLTRALTFLVISCPCALVISVPLSFFGGIGCASKHGILIKGSNYLEALSKAETFVFDKTGTLTEGSFEVSAIHPKEIGEAALIKLAASVEWFSSHPIASSLKSKLDNPDDRYDVSDITEIAGQGITATIGKAVVYVGNSKLMNSINADYKECHKSGTTVHIAVNGKYAGHIVISDKIKADSKDAVLGLKSLGVSKAIMLTGDKSDVAKTVAEEIGIDDYRANLLPGDKVAVIETLMHQKAKGKALAFVGDGINDAPVLARADVGIAMGALGSDAAIEAADIVLMDDKPSKIAVAMRISRKTLQIVKENIVFSLLIKAIILLLGAFGSASMWLAVIADVGVSVIAILNSVRTLNY